MSSVDGDVDGATSSLSVAAAISGASATLAQSHEEPKLKKVKLNHYNYFKSHLFAGGMAQSNNVMLGSGSGGAGGSCNTSDFYVTHKKLEDRIGGILCCTVCLDLPSTAIYQVSQNTFCRAKIVNPSHNFNHFSQISIVTT